MSLEDGNQVSIEQCGSQTKVFIDGKEIVGLRSVNFESEATYTPIVTVSFYPKITKINKGEKA